jgi:hypothetical protein
MIMSYGTTERFASKKALREAVAARGADNVTVTDTSIFDNKGTVTVASLAGTSAVIVGPDVHRDRRWYANAKVKKDGSITIG